MRFLQAFARICGDFSRRLVKTSAGLPLEEPLARYIFSRSHFSTTRVKPRAFHPPPNLRLSVFRIQELEDSDIWAIGGNIASERDETLRARADITVGAVEQRGLSVEPDNTPPRHATICAWPPEKSARLLKAQELAKASTLRIVP